MGEIAKDKEYTSCIWLQHGINIHTEGIKHCCMFFHKNGGLTKPITYLQPEGLNIDYIFSIKSFLREQNKNGKICDECQGCAKLETRAWEDEDYLTNLVIETNTHCNSDCLYCFTRANKKYYNSFKQFFIFDSIKKLVCERKIRPTDESEIVFGGGEPTLNKEFDKLVKLFLEHNFPLIKVNTSGIKFSKMLEKCIKRGCAEVTVSVDAGTKETFRKIKQVDKYKVVWANLNKYAKAQINNKFQVCAKYIICCGINDKISEIDLFFEKVRENNIRFVKFDVETYWYKHYRNNKQKIEHIFKLLNYAEQKAKNIDDLKFVIHCQASSAIKENIEIYNKTRELN